MRAIKKSTHDQIACFASVHFEPENWPTLDELPEADTSDLVRTYQENQDGVVPED